jgi:hypothetical protein
VARVAAERAARRLARKRLMGALATLPVVGGGTVAERLSRLPEAVLALEKEVEEAPPSRVRHASDGGIEMELHISLRRIAQVLAGPDEADADGGKGPRRIVLWAGAGKPVVVPGADVRYYATATEAKRDVEWLGPSPKTVKLRSLTEAELRGGRVAVVVQP